MLTCDLSILLAFLFVSGFLLSDLLLLVIDLLEVELVASVFLVLLVSNQYHHEDPYVYEEEASDVEPHRFLGVGLSEGNMTPEDQGLYAVESKKG